MTDLQTRLQTRIQRYGWDLAADRYENLWEPQLGVLRSRLLAYARLSPGESVLDVACGTGSISMKAAYSVGFYGDVLGVDLSGRMVEQANARARILRLANLGFERMDAEELALPDARFDAALCVLGLMYAPRPQLALTEMRRVLRPGGRLVTAVWGEASRCAWSGVFDVVNDELASQACPLFFGLGSLDALARQCAAAGFHQVEQFRMPTVLTFLDADEACDALFVGGPLALAWSRFDTATRRRVRTRYLQRIAPYRCGNCYALPAEFVMVRALASAVSDVTPRTAALVQ